MIPSVPAPDLPHNRESLAFCLRLRVGCEAEYRRRHDALWPEMRAALVSAGVLQYEIYLETESMLLFALIVRRSDHSMEALPEQPVWRHWQQHMADLIAQEDGLPLRIPLKCMFRLHSESTAPLAGE
jgi:L-rhamnose mutarotase